MTDESLTDAAEAVGNHAHHHLIGVSTSENWAAWRRRVAREAADQWLAPLVAAAKAEAWEVGYLRGALDSESDLDRADNPYPCGADYSPPLPDAYRNAGGYVWLNLRKHPHGLGGVYDPDSRGTVALYLTEAP